MLRTDKGGGMSATTKLARGWKIAIGVAFGFFGIFVLGIIGAATTPQQTSQANPQVAGDTQKAEVLGSSTQKSQPKAPVVTTKQVTETEPVPFTSTTVNSAALAKGTSKVTTVGVNGTSTLTYKVTYTDGKQTKKELVSKLTTTPPITQVTTIGTYVAPAPVPAPVPAPTPVASSSCDPNYSGACVPIASDVDCAGGSGNGPAYVAGPVRVIGSDIYGLDRDHNGIGCE